MISGRELGESSAYPDFRGGGIRLTPLPKLEPEHPIVQPRHPDPLPREARFDEERIVGALGVAHRDRLRADLHLPQGVDEPPVELLRVRLLEAGDPPGEEPVQEVAGHGEGYREVHLDSRSSPLS